MSKEASFHAARRMWGIIDGQVQFAEPGDTRGHLQWFAAMGWGPFEEIVRGFYLNGRLFAYKGHNFEHWGCYQAILPVADQFKDIVPADAEVYFGARPGEVGEEWKGYAYGGTYAELLGESK